MISKEKIFVQQIMCDVFSYECNKVKEGKTIRIQIFDKHKGSTSKKEKDFKNFEDAMKYLISEKRGKVND